ILLSAAFGFGMTAFTTFLLAALQLLTLRNVLLIDVAFFSAVFLLPRRTLEFPRIEIVLTSFEKKLLIFVGFILFLGFLYAVLFPPLEWDSLAYQAYYSKLIFEYGGLPSLFGPSIGIEMSAAYPPAYQMLGCYIYVIMNEPNAHFMSVFSYMAGVLTLVIIFLYAHLLVPSHRVYAVLCALAVPFFLAFSASPHYMTLLILFNSLFLYYLTKYVLEDHKPSLYLGAVFLGFACLTSYLALASFLFLIIAFIKKRYSIKTFFMTFFIPGILAFPPFLRNFYFTGNPLFPLFGIGYQLNNQLWVSNTIHFKTQTIYAGLQVTSAFSILDFFMNRISSIRPLLPLLMVIGVLFLLFVRPRGVRKWLIICFLASIFIFLVKPTFDRYLLIYICVYATFFAWLLHKSEELHFTLLRRSLTFTLTASLSILVVGLLITGPMMMASHVKQFPEQPLDQWAYVRQFYPHDTPCWRWLNEHTPSNQYVATYDIRYYYIDKKIFPLDGLEAIPLYTLSHEEALAFLKEKNIVYWFSSRWTSPIDETCPLAYFDNPLTPFLGSDILPLVFVFVSGQSAVYGVDIRNIDYQNILETENVLYPVHGYNYKFDEGRMIYFDIPGDFHKKKVTLHFSRPVRAGLYKGHAASPLLLGELVQEGVGEDFQFIAYAGKYTLFIESLEPFTLTVFLV
ncbi:MAG: glycosyltransferase family 39 protein, partial [Theionarchaea archaeon]|nr:glycosyltransferase family 39 protein [Theionarchaea archaeon]